MFLTLFWGRNDRDVSFQGKDVCSARFLSEVNLGVIFGMPKEIPQSLKTALLRDQVCLTQGLEGWICILNQHLLHSHKFLSRGQRLHEETGDEMHMGVCPRGTAKWEVIRNGSSPNMLTWSDQNCYFHLKSQTPCNKLFPYAHKDTDKSALLVRLKTAELGFFWKDVFYIYYQRETCHFIFSWEYVSLDITLDYIYCRQWAEKIHLCPGPWSTWHHPQAFFWKLRN